MNALTNTVDMQANVGETVRMFFGVGGPNLTSSFHLIGEVFDRVHDLASFTSPPLTDVQTTLVPPGGATMVEFKVDVPGNYVLVDHALSRMEKGLSGILQVAGKEDHTIFHSRSEENTSELQSLMVISYAALCLKKNTMVMINSRSTEKK